MAGAKGFSAEAAAEGPTPRSQLLIILSVNQWPQAPCQNHYFISGMGGAQLCLCQEGNVVAPGFTVAEFWVYLSSKNLLNGHNKTLFYPLLPWREQEGMLVSGHIIRGEAEGKPRREADAFLLLGWLSILWVAAA